MNHSVLRAADILELFAASAESLTVSEVARALEIPKSSAFDILAALSHKGFLRVDDPKAKTYSLGIGAYRVGMAYIGRMDLYTAAHGLLAALCRQLGQTVYLAVPEGDHVVYVDKLESDSPIRFTMRAGNKNPMYCTGLGKAILSCREEAAVRSVIPQALPYRTETTLTTIDALLADLALTRKRGYALDLGEDNALLRCLAVPIRQAGGECVAAISTSMLASDFQQQDPDHLGALLTQTALAISHSLGYDQNSLF